MSASEDPVDVVVTIAQAHPFDAVVGRLQGAGLDVTGTMPGIGTVTGRAAPERLEQIEAVEGVSGLERSREYRLAPPSSDVQ
jgi:hypothetical protein